MGTKTIRLDEDVYERLKAKKRAGETFSEAVGRLLDDWSLLDLAGTYTDEEARRHRELLERSERDANEDVADLLEQMGVERE
ncbi:MAG: antitoxin VapB family protein [Haloarculaceae archaeon]